MADAQVGGSKDHGGNGDTRAGGDARRAASKEFDGLVQEVARGHISRRQFLVQALAMGLSLTAIGSILSACGSGGADAEETGGPIVSDTTKPDTLYLYNQANYLDPSIQEKFTKETGIKITTAYYDTPEIMMAKLRGGGEYDVVWPPNYLIQPMTKSGMLHPLDMALIPSFAGVRESLQKPAFDPETDGNKYSVPYTVGWNAIVARTDKTQGDVTSWQSMWDPVYKRKLQMLDAERDTLGAALKYLGYSMNTTSQDELDKAVAALIDQKPLVLRYDSINPARAVIEGVTLVHAWDANAVLGAREVGEENVAMVYPTEGFQAWVDCMAVPKQAPSPYGAHLWLDFILKPENAAATTNFTGFQSGVEGLDTMIDDPLMTKYVATPEEQKRAEMSLDVGEFARNYSEAWSQVKAG